MNRTMRNSLGINGSILRFMGRFAGRELASGPPPGFETVSVIDLLP